MRRLLVVIFCLSALAYPQDPAESIAKLERCIHDVSQDVSKGGRDCRGKALARVVAIYNAGDLSLLPLILRAHNLRFAGKQPDPARLYIDIFEQRPQPFLSTLGTLRSDDQDGVIYGFADVSLTLPLEKVEGLRQTLRSETKSDVAKRLLYAVEMKNASRITQYFPAGTFGGQFEGSDRTIGRIYASYLFALGEPPIYTEKPAAGEAIYRFLWVRAFGDPVSVRLHVLPDGGGVATLKVCQRGAMDPGVLVTNKEVRIDPADVKSFLELLANANFWDEPTRERRNGSTVGFDGAQWIIEAIDGSRYHLVDRWSPKTGPYREAALLLLKKSGYPLKSDPTD